MNVTQPVLDVLSRSACTSSGLVLSAALDRKLYLQVAKVIEAAGGKWDRSLQAHVFAGDAAEAIEPIILTGKVSDQRREFDFFETPPALARRLAQMADVRGARGKAVLEPSAGRGALVLAALAEGAGRVDWVEKDERHKSALEALSPARCSGQICDFFELNHDPSYDVVLMNPPFSKRQDIAHVRRAFGFVRPGGRLVSVMSAGVVFRQDALGVQFREWLRDHDSMIDNLPSGSFKASGTSVNAVVVVIIKERAEA